MKSSEPRGERSRRRILEALAAEPKTTKTLAAELHMHFSTVLLHIGLMRRDKLLHIAGYEPTHKNRPAPKYGLGGRPDVIYRPAPRTICVRRSDLQSSRMVGALKEGLIPVNSYASA